MRTTLRILVSPFWALILLAVLMFTLVALVAMRLWATAGEIVVPVRAQLSGSGQRDTPLLMALLAQAVNLGVGVAVYLGVLQQASVTSVEALVTPMVTGFVSFLISALHGHFAQKSYAVQAAHGLLMGAGPPAGVGSGNPPLEPVRGPESEPGWENRTHVQEPQRGSPAGSPGVPAPAGPGAPPQP